MPKKTLRNKRKTRFTRGGNRNSKNLAYNLAAAKYNVNIVLFTELPVPDEIVLEIFTILKKLYGDTVSYQTHETPTEWYSFQEVSGLPANLYDAHEVVYTIDPVPEFLKLTAANYRKDSNSQSNVIDMKLTELENQISNALPPHIKLIDSPPGVHTDEWINHDDKWQRPYVYKVGLTLS